MLCSPRPALAPHSKAIVNLGWRFADIASLETNSGFGSEPVDPPGNPNAANLSPITP